MERCCVKKQGKGEKTRMKVLLFKTSVMHRHEVEKLKVLLNNLLQNDHWTFDLEDCDRVLRIVSDRVRHTQVMDLLQGEGFVCEELED